MTLLASGGEQFHWEVHALLRREHEAQLAMIDEELEALGRGPEPLEPISDRKAIVIEELIPSITSEANGD